MAKRKGDLNTVYISERLQECLRPIAHCALTTVVAPMGYGKTTAINWYLEERAKAEPLRVIRIAETLSASAETRGIDLKRRKSNYLSLRFSVWDVVFCVLLAAWIAAGLIL